MIELMMDRLVANFEAGIISEEEYNQAIDDLIKLQEE